MRLEASLTFSLNSGIRCGPDIAKAMALGARMCFIGRSYVYGLVLGVQAGVSHVLKSVVNINHNMLSGTTALFFLTTVMSPG